MGVDFFGVIEDELLAGVASDRDPEVDRRAVVLGTEVKLEMPEPYDIEIVTSGATKRILGIDDSSIRVAVMVLCVSGKAPIWPLHMLYASVTTMAEMKSAERKLRSRS